MGFDKGMNRIEAARVLGVSPFTIDEWAAAGMPAIAATSVRGALYDAEACRGWIAARAQPVKPSAATQPASSPSKPAIDTEGIYAARQAQSHQARRAAASAQTVEDLEVGMRSEIRESESRLRAELAGRGTGTAPPASAAPKESGRTLESIAADVYTRRAGGTSQ